MAIAAFHKGQRVYVEPVGTWALIEAVIPHWTKGVEVPMGIVYDVGLGREFTEEELVGIETADTTDFVDEDAQWRLTRANNRWKPAEECHHHPYPGTHPVVITSDAEWGGWRVPAAEYDLNPNRIEMQARIIAQSVQCVALLRKFTKYADQQAENMPDQLGDMAEDARVILAAIES